MTQARSSRTGRVITVLHGSGVDGATIAEIASRADVPAYKVTEILHRLRAKQPRRANVLKLRRDVPTNAATGRRERLVEVWGCTCPLRHDGASESRPSAAAAGPLDEHTREIGRAGVAACRELLDRAADRPGRHSPQAS